MILRSTAPIDLPKNSPSAFPRADGQPLQLKSLNVALAGALFWSLT